MTICPSRHEPRLLGLALLAAGLMADCTGTSTEVRERASLGAREGTAYRGETVAVLPFGGPNGPIARDVIIRVLAEQQGARVLGPSAVDSYLFSSRLQPNPYDVATMGAISAGLHAPVVFWGEVDQFTPYHFDRFVPATPAYVELTTNTWSSAEGRTRTATINKQGALPLTIWDKQPTFQDVALAEVSDFFAGR
jgi:hypothetical protein